MPRTTEDQLAMAGYIRCPSCGEWYKDNCRCTINFPDKKVGKKKNCQIKQDKKDNNFIKSYLKFKEKE